MNPPPVMVPRVIFYPPTWEVKVVTELAAVFMTEDPQFVQLFQSQVLKNY